jgi:hypothetical protein
MALIPEIEIYQTAALLVKAKGGDGATGHARAMVKAWADNGDTEGAAVWGRIAKAIEVLLSDTPTGMVN